MQQTVDDSYRELGLTSECSDADVKAAWRRLAAQWHPDRNPNPQALKKIQKINRALEEIRKARGDANVRPEPAGHERAAPPRRTLHHTIEITLEEAVAGCTRDIRGEVVDDCPACVGSGVEPQARECPECEGSGHIRKNLWFGWVPSIAQCDACAGHGVTRNACSACEGTGKQPPHAYHGRLDIPPGTRAGDVIHVSARVHGQKQKVAMQVRVELQAHEFFELSTDGTVKCEIPVDGFAWMANRWIEVPTPGGLRQMRLQRGHLVYRIKEPGFTCMVTAVPLFPEEFSAEQDAAVDWLIGSNTLSPGTACGQRMSAWVQGVERWHERVA